VHKHIIISRSTTTKKSLTLSQERKGLGTMKSSHQVLVTSLFLCIFAYERENFPQPPSAISEKRERRKNINNEQNSLMLM
jgi:hypothetical protein